MAFREIISGGKTEELRLILFCSTNAMLLVGVALTSETVKERVVSHNLKVSLKIITVSSVNRSKEPCDSCTLLESHDRNHRKHSAGYYYYSFKLSALKSSCRVIWHENIYAKHIKR